MGNIMDTFGTLATSFLRAVSEIWSWLNSPLKMFGFNVQINGWSVVPIQIFGVGFGIVVIAVFIKSVVTW